MVFFSLLLWHKGIIGHQKREDLPSSQPAVCCMPSCFPEFYEGWKCTSSCCVWSLIPAVVFLPTFLQVLFWIDMFFKGIYKSNLFSLQHSWGDLSWTAWLSLHSWWILALWFGIWSRHDLVVFQKFQSQPDFLVCVLCSCVKGWRVRTAHCSWCC